MQRLIELTLSQNYLKGIFQTNLFRIHKFNKNTKIIEDVIDQFQKESENFKPNNSVKIEDLLKDRWVSDASTYHLFKTPAELEKFRKIKLNTSLFYVKVRKISVMDAK